MALLGVAADWARDHGRRLLALTVDHGLNPYSEDWTAVARDAARAVGADWRGLVWTGDKPSTGLPAAARRARHALIADAARAAGGRVALFAHTADDVAEADLMRDGGSTLGRVRDWSPSPVWPEGRGLMLLRPMLDVGRAELRDWLVARRVGWIDDPSNADPRFARSRARRALAGGETAVERTGGPLRDDGPPPTPEAEGVIAVGRAVSAHALSVALVCAGGGQAMPRGDRLASVLTRLRSGEDFAATLRGARVEADGDAVRITREAGEFVRRPPAGAGLAAGVETVWDGRHAVLVEAPGWFVAPAAGRIASLGKADRVWLNGLPPAARGAQPVLIRDDGGGAFLAVPAGKAWSLVEERLALALDRMTHERELGALVHGATPSNPLFSNADITGTPETTGPRRTERA